MLNKYLEYLPWILIGLGAIPLFWALIVLAITGSITGILGIIPKLVNAISSIGTSLRRYKDQKIHKSGLRLSAEILVAILGAFVSAKGLGTTTYTITQSWHVTSLVVVICIFGLAIIILRQITIFNDAWAKPRPLWNWLLVSLVAPVALLIALWPDQPKFKVGQAIVTYGAGDPYHGTVLKVRKTSGTFEYFVDLPGTQHWVSEFRLYTKEV